MHQSDVMPHRTVPFACALAGLCLAILQTTPVGAQTRGRVAARAPRQSVHRSAGPPLACGDLLGFQVLLDRRGFSPGEIDGKIGDNFAHALSALQTSRKIAVTGRPDCDTWHTLGGDTAGSLMITYSVTDADV